MASFEDVCLLYRSDQHSVLKLASRLTAKSCWPSNLERQNVSLALRVFDDSTAAALAIQDSSRQTFNYQTSDFIKIITRVWKIFNVNTHVKGIHLKDEYSMPLRYNDARFSFLSHLISWLDNWLNMQDSGKLSKQTFTSFKHSTISLTKVVNHLTENCGFDYVLTSFLQNDPLEQGCSNGGPRATCGPRDHSLVINYRYSTNASMFRSLGRYFCNVILL